MSPLDMTHYVGDGCPGGHRDLCGTPGFDHYWALLAPSPTVVGTATCLLCGVAK